MEYKASVETFIKCINICIPKYLRPKCVICHILSYIYIHTSDIIKSNNLSLMKYTLKKKIPYSYMSIAIETKNIHTVKYIYNLLILEYLDLSDNFFMYKALYTYNVDIINFIKDNFLITMTNTLRETITKVSIKEPAIKEIFKI